MPEPWGARLGKRIHVVGNSSSGKSTLAEELSGRLEVPFVELDALNWQPGWVSLVETAPDEFERRVREATAGEGWVVAGSYMRFAQPVFWDRTETVVWIDLPTPILVGRVILRSWRRWRSKELLWGTNYEGFWRQLMVWRREESLVWWIITQQKPKRKEMLAAMSDPRWSHIRFLRLGSASAVRVFCQSLVATEDRA